MEKPLTEVRTEGWYGRRSNSSAHKLPPGAAVLHENLRCQVPGQMDVRPGMRSANVSADAAVINVVTYPAPPAANDYLIVQDTLGHINYLTPS